MSQMLPDEIDDDAPLASGRYSRHCATPPVSGHAKLPKGGASSTGRCKTQNY